MGAERRRELPQVHDPDEVVKSSRSQAASFHEKHGRGAPPSKFSFTILPIPHVVDDQHLNYVSRHNMSNAALNENCLLPASRNSDLRSGTRYSSITLLFVPSSSESEAVAAMRSK